MEMEETFSEVDSQQTVRDYTSVESGQGTPEDDQDTLSVYTCSSHSDTDSTDSNILNYFLDFEDIIGKDMVICSYMKPKVLYLYKPSPADTLKSLAMFVKNNMEYNHNFHRMAILFSNEAYPQDIGDVVTLKPGTALLVLPKTFSKITILIHRLNVLFEVDIDLCSHVFEIKHRIEDEYGFPVLQQDLLHIGHCLENQDRLYQYKIRSQSVLDLHLHYHYNMVVSVKTFWKSAYDLFVDPCMLVSDVLETILKRCVSPNVYKDISLLQDFMIPSQMLILTTKGRTLNPGSSLGQYHIKDGDIINLTTIGRQHRVNVYPIEVSLNDGRAARIVVSQFDTWAIVALHIHGITAIPLDKIRLFHENNQVNYAKPIGNSVIGNVEIKYPQQGRRHQKKSNNKDMCPTEVSVIVYLGSSVTETIKCPVNYNMCDIKERLEEMGIPNARHYNLSTKYSTLPDTTVLKNIFMKDFSSVKISLKLEQFPLTIQLPNNNLVNITVQVNQSIETMLDMIQKKSKLSFKHYKLLLGGNEYIEAPDTLVYDSRVCIGTTLYLVHKKRDLSFHIHSDTMTTRLQLPPIQIPSQIKQTLWSENHLPSSCLSSLETFLKWHMSLVIVKDTHQGTTMELPNISPYTYSDFQTSHVQEVTVNHSAYRNPPGHSGQTELSPKTGTIQIPCKTVKFADDHVLSRPRAARSHRKRPEESHRKLANIVRPVFGEAELFETDHISELSTMFSNWPASNTTSDLAEISLLSQMPQESGLKTGVDVLKTEVSGEAESTAASKTKGEIEPWSYIS